MIKVASRKVKIGWVHDMNLQAGRATECTWVQQVDWVLNRACSWKNEPGQEVLHSLISAFETG